MSYRNIEDKRKYAREWIAARRAKFFKDKYCVECGSVKKLELDHIDPSTKIDHKIWSWAEKRRKEEIAKCQVLCRICHIEKTIIEKTVPIVHNTLCGYKNGCRCILCKEANAKYEYKRRRGLA